MRQATLSHYLLQLLGRLLQAEVTLRLYDEHVVKHNLEKIPLDNHFVFTSLDVEIHASECLALEHLKGLDEDEADYFIKGGAVEVEATC